MEVYLISNLISKITQNESPSNILLCAIDIYILVSMRGLRGDFKLFNKSINNRFENVNKKVNALKESIDESNIIRLDERASNDAHKKT